MNGMFCLLSGAKRTIEQDSLTDFKVAIVLWAAISCLWDVIIVHCCPELGLSVILTPRLHQYSATVSIPGAA
jgi:hypothetical protein